MKKWLILVASVSPVFPAAAQTSRPASVALPKPDAVLSAEFTMVSDVRELADGRVLVVDQVERVLHVVDFGKGAVARVGRTGSGPKEYLQPLTLLATGADSTIVPDPRNGRWLLLKGADIVGTVGPEAPVLTAGTRAPNGADNHGHVIALKSMSTGPVTPTSLPRRDSVLLVRMSRATARQDTVATLLARPSQLRIEGPAAAPTNVSITMNPLSSGEGSALFPDGWIAIVRLDPYRVDWIGPRGQRALGAPLPFERIRLDERERRAFLEREAVRTGRPPRDPASIADWPEYVKPFSGAPLTAPDGSLWIRRQESSTNLNPPYDVVNRKGELTARISVENGVTIVGFGNGVVYTTVTDDNGIQKLQRRMLPSLKP